jgi:hypothetical protein
MAILIMMPGENSKNNITNKSQLTATKTRGSVS